jgi:hypothetical protein
LTDVDKGVRKDDFEGCDYDHIIVFDDNTGVRCTSYSYSYSYSSSGGDAAPR